jgi:hypothetical protein
VGEHADGAVAAAGMVPTASGSAARVTVVRRGERVPADDTGPVRALLPCLLSTNSL